MAAQPALLVEYFGVGNIQETFCQFPSCEISRKIWNANSLKIFWDPKRQKLNHIFLFMMWFDFDTVNCKLGIIERGGHSPV